jgi:CheY-like chemotaxis protein
MRRLMAAALRGSGHQVYEAADGLDLLALIQGLRSDEARGERDVVVTDVRMPGASGLDVLAALRSLELAIPVVIVTGFGDTETHSEAWRLGASAVFDKPFDLVELQQTVAWLAFSGTAPENNNGVA